MNINRYTITYLPLILIVASIPSLLGQVRSYDGYGNNESNPDYGAVGTAVRLISPLTYEDEIGEPTGIDRPNPRHISNVLFTQTEPIYDEHELTDYVWVFGQFIDHDITLIGESETEPALISVPECDAVFDPMCLGQSAILMMRSEAMEGTGVTTEAPRMYANQISAYIDGSAVYGSTVERANWLRTFEEGKLKTSTGDLLPYNTLTGELNGATDDSAPEMAMNDADATRWFVAGDVRANENVLLTAMHTLFVREHNRLCDELKLRYPNAGDEQLYQRARKMVGGMIQAITYNEWLPSMGVAMDDYTGYRKDVNANVTNVFSGAAFRFGHTLLSNTILRMEDGCETIPEGDMTLREAFFNPSLVLSSGIDPLFKGMSTQIQQALDCKVIDDVRNFLFGPPGAPFGLDLAAININRGRERGLADYNTLRDVLGLGKVRSFNEICEDPVEAQILESLYESVDRIDPWVGMLAEEHMPGAILGETTMTIMKEQFKALRDGDRFFYRVDPELSVDEVQEIDETRFADIIMRNTTIQALQPDVFKMIRTCHVVHVEERHLDVNAFPNPIRDNVTLTIFSFEDGEAELSITNLLGQQVQRRQIDLAKGINNFQFPVNSALQPGIYNLYLEMGARNNTIKLFKRN